MLRDIDPSIKKLLVLGTIAFSSGLYLTLVLFGGSTETEPSPTQLSQENNPDTSKISEEMPTLPTQEPSPLPPSGATTGTITILGPAWLIEDQISGLIKTLQQKDITLHLQQPIYQSGHRRTQYKQAVSGALINGSSDIIMIPRDRRPDLSDKAYKIQLQENLQENQRQPTVGSLFEQNFFDAIYDQTGTFIPVFIDPLISIVHPSLDINRTSTTFEEIMTLGITETKKNHLSLPFLFGLTRNDLRLMEQNNEPYPHYALIVQELLTQLRGFNTINAIQNFFDITTNNLGGDLVAIKRIINRIEARIPFCHIDNKICILSTNLGQIALGTLSDGIIWQHYFSGQSQKFGPDYIAGFPRSSTSYPARGRGIMINKRSPHIIQSLITINEYLKNPGLIDNDLLLHAHLPLLQTKKNLTPLRSSVPFMLVSGGFDNASSLINNSLLMQTYLGTATSAQFFQDPFFMR